MIKKIQLFFILSMLSAYVVFGQEDHSPMTKKKYELDARYLQGFVIKHDRFMGEIAKGITRGFEARVTKRTTGETRWQRLAGYPDIRLSLAYMDYASDIIGESVALNYNSDYYILRRPKISSTLGLGFGLGFHTRPYDKETNNKNIVYGSPVTFSLQTAFNFKYHFHPDWAVNAGVLFSHFSMADIKRPNAGLNNLLGEIGVSYFPGRENEIISKMPEDYLFDKKWRFSVNTNFTMATYKVVDKTAYPVFVATIFAQRPVSPLFDLGISLDYFNNTVLKEVKKDDQELENDENPDHKKAGVSAVVEYHMNRLSIWLNIGYYVYKPYYYYGNTYQRYGLKYYFSEHIFAVAGFKSHGADAEHSEFGFGYRF